MLAGLGKETSLLSVATLLTICFILINLLQKREPLESTYQAARENAKISDDMFIKLNRLERTRQ